MPGPAPKSNARRRNKENAWSVLPARCDRRPPPWPAELGSPSKVERKLWRKVWATPMAEAWHQAGWSVEVAIYVGLVSSLGPRMLADGTEIPAKVDKDTLAEIRQLGDRLGMTTLARTRHRWSIAADEVAEARAERSSARERLRAVDSDALARS